MVICEKIIELEHRILKGESYKEFKPLIDSIRKDAERMENRLLLYRRSIEILGFERVKHKE